MISVVVPTLNAAARLDACLAALAPAALSGLVREVVVSDGGSQDATGAIALAWGARLVEGERGRGAQLAAGARAARGEWLLFLHADTVLEAGWDEEAAGVLGDPGRAHVFTLAFDDSSAAARLVAIGAMARTRLLAAPYGDQGLLVSRALYAETGGYGAMPLFEDVDLVSRIARARGRKAIRVLKARAVTSAERYRREGYARRVMRNAWCLALYRLGVPPERIAEIYAR